MVKIYKRKIEMKAINTRIAGKWNLMSVFLLAAVMAFCPLVVAQTNPSDEQSERLVKVGDIIQFRDGSKGVVCHVNSDSPYTGWVVALEDFNVSALKMMPTNYCEFLNDMGGCTRGSDMIGWITTYSVTSEEWPSIGYENTRRLLENGSPIAQALAESDDYNFYNGWYIPDAFQMQSWFTKLPIIRDSANANGDNIPASGATPANDRYWSSSREGNNRMVYLDYATGQMKAIGPNSTGLKLRPVRDFNLGEAFVYWDSLAANGDTNNVMNVSPPVTTDYGATIEYGTHEFHLTSTVLVHDSYDRDTISDVVCKTNSRYSWRLHDNFYNKDITRSIKPDTMTARPEPYFYRDTLHTTNGCDSIVTHKIWIIDNCEYIVKDTICPLKEGGQYHLDTTFVLGTGYDHNFRYDTTFSFGTTPGLYEHYDTISYTEGDVTSQIPLTAYLYLYFYDTYFFEEEAVVCNNEQEYQWANHRTLAIPAEAGTYIYWDSLETQNGCDSIYKLSLTVKAASTGTDVQSACDTYTWIDGVTYTESTNTPTYNLTNAVGCDSVVTLNLTIYKSPQVTLSEQTVCNNVGTADIKAQVTPGSSSDLSYSWTGYADFVPSTQQSNPVSIKIPDDPDACDAEYPVTLTVTQNGCSTTVDATVRVESTIPVITPRVPLDSLIAWYRTWLRIRCP